MERGVVKSAGRVLALFEHLREVRVAVSVSEVARALDMPQSSASVLLRSLETLGYLAYDVDVRRFRATYRVAMLGDWVQDVAFDTPVHEMMEALSRETGETILLGQQNGSSLQYVHIIRASYPVQLHIPFGTRRPMICSATGMALLSLKAERQIRAVVRRNNADLQDSWQRVREDEFLVEIDRIRARGYAQTSGNMTPGAAVIAMSVPLDAKTPPLALGVGGPIERIESRIADLIVTMRRVIGRGPLAP